MLKEKLAENGLVHKLYARYMDDGRVAMHPVRAGWMVVGWIFFS